MIKGSSFHLRHVRKDDIPQLITLMNSPEAKGEFLSLELMLPGVLEKKFEAESQSKETSETFLIIDGHEVNRGAILGRVFHFKTVPYFNSREIGYGMFTNEMRGKGIMTEAVRMLTDYLFKTTLINRLEIHMKVDNIASEKVAINCGYLKEGIARGASFSRGRHIDIAMYALLREEWEQLAG
ncbi:GNAT family N-acetyltransferase [Undibacterium sp. Jales W-56]|uniref:GNAT family N-acetyltransferase n=1 Tax=Undibacterium sp. Jales W-56 TaxID=2897325 RepID=UPI0021D0BE9A|nr:GNAT family protein [Undibacterium sp. Jales W-56]MCU6435622.1 GNAT family N-acetyltransferase [Undibacterium sp. Jales W-56]